jgi:hypothetical protein
MKSIGPGRYSAFSAIRSSRRSGLACTSVSFMPPDSNWNTAVVLARLEHGVIGGAVVQRQGGEVDVHALDFLHQAHRLVEDGQRAQAEEVELDQAGLLDVVLVELRDHRVGAGGGVQRAEVGQLARRDHHAAGMHADVARQAFQLQRQRPQFGNFLLVVDAPADRGFLLQRILERDAEFVGDQLGELVDEIEAEVEHAADIAHHRLGRHGAEGDDLRHGVAPYFFFT